MRNFVRSIARLWSSELGGGPLEDAHAAYDKQDYATARRLYRPLADQGDAWAQTRLGFMYDLGQGVPQDYVEAHKWFRLAADQGHAWAQSYLGIMYYLGQGVPQDYVEAHKWFNLSAARASADEKYVRDLGVKTRDRVAGKMTPAQVAEAQKRASAWQPK